MKALAEIEAPAMDTAAGDPKKISFMGRTTVSATNNADEFLIEIEKHKDAFYRFVRRTVWDPGEADDVFSAAVLAAYENRHKYTPGTNFRAWMYRILQNKCFVANRDTGRRMEPLETVENSFVAIAEASEHWDVLADPKRILEACGDEVYRAFSKLSMAQRTCIMLKAVERFTYQEISDTLEIPVGTVMTHLSRGRAKLRKLLADYAIEIGLIPTAAEG